MVANAQKQIISPHPQLELEYAQVVSPRTKC